MLLVWLICLLSIGGLRDWAGTVTTNAIKCPLRCPHCWANAMKCTLTVNSCFLLFIRWMHIWTYAHASIHTTVSDMDIDYCMHAHYKTWWRQWEDEFVYCPNIEKWKNCKRNSLTRTASNMSMYLQRVCFTCLAHVQSGMSSQYIGSVGNLLKNKFLGCMRTS